MPPATQPKWVRTTRTRWPAFISSGEPPPMSTPRVLRNLSQSCQREEPKVRIHLTPPSSPSPFTIRPKMIEICAYAANYAWLVAPENAPNRAFRRSAARLIRKDQIRGHGENAPDHLRTGSIDPGDGSGAMKVNAARLHACCATTFLLVESARGILGRRSIWI